MADNVRMSSIEGHVALIEIDRPPTNALDAQSCAALLEIFDTLQNQHEIRAIVLTGIGKAFCSGADLKQVGADNLLLFGKLLEQVASSRAAVIAAINGNCIGGGFELALCCDLRIASTEAKFVCAGVNVGLIASTYRLPRLIGVARAKAMLLTGLPFDAATAEAWGLVTAIYQPHALRAAAFELAQRIASRAPLAVEAAKRCADRAPDMSPDEAREMLSREMPVLRASRDHKEALTAFREKRNPVFSRR